jgi:isocitrate dehydrogenase
MISNRGTRIWPEGHPETFCIEQYRCRFTHKTKGQGIGAHEVISLLDNLVKSGYDIIKTENLYAFDGASGY